MTRRVRARKNILKRIFEDGWEEFKRKYPRYEGVDEGVEKMVGCGDPANGHAVYICPNCFQEHWVPFSCKSTFCLSCAKVYSRDWVETVKGMLHPGIGYRHLTLTLPAGLRTVIYRQPAELLDGLMKAVPGAMDEAVLVAKLVRWSWATSSCCRRLGGQRPTIPTCMC